MTATAQAPLARAAEAPTFILGLPYVARGPLLETARAIGAPVLVSANAFSERRNRGGWREWVRFRTGRLALLDGLDAYLDSAGFVAAQRYGGYDWSVDAYLDLCASYPFRAFSAMDYCVEPEVADNRDAVLDRISMTVASLHECMRGAQERGIADRLMPVVQGWGCDEYARCLERMPGVESTPLLGVGSVCRRPVNGPNGVLAVVDRIHDELGDAPARLHLFGVKNEAAALLRDHPRVGSFDSQAYGFRARVLAREGGFSKTNAFLADVMKEWYLRQAQTLARPAGPMVPRQTAIAFAENITDDPIMRRVERAREQMRELVERGEMDATRLHDLAAFHWAFDTDDDEDDF